MSALRFNFGRQVLVLIGALLIIPVAVTAYMLHVINGSERAIIEGQKKRLTQAVDLLDASLTSDFDSLLRERGVSPDTASREKVAVLNRALRATITEVARAYPGSQVGFYSAELDKVIDGSPSEYAGENFSPRRRDSFHQAMQGGALATAYADPSSGFVEVYKPLVRNGQVIGAVWATENLSQFSAREAAVARTAYLIIAVGVILGLGGALLVLHRFLGNVNRVKIGLAGLSSDLENLLPPAEGEFGEITRAINNLAVQLVNTRRYNEITLATIDDGLLVIDPDERVIISNTAAGRMFGLSASPVGRRLADLWPATSELASLLRQALSGKTARDVVIAWNAGGHTLRLLASTAVLHNAREEVIGAVICCRDITERLRLQEQVRRQERLAALGKVVTGVAHEIRNPLTSISCYIQLWRKNRVPSQRALQTIDQQIARLDSLIEQLLYFGKPAETMLAPHSLNAVVEKVLRFFTEVHISNLEVISSLDPDLPPALIDPEQIERVLMNVIYNACQAMPATGRLTVNTAAVPEVNQVLVTVTDTGCGIPEDQLPHVCEPFYSTREEGTGLGLALAYEIVSGHGGRLEIESQVGQGTTVRIFLQAAQEEAESSERELDSCCG